jgi:saccharopine dehydrogenase-like NADP-dependent oxidoreductase
VGEHRYVVFGAGRQGTAAVHDLVRNCEAGAVLVVEPDAKRLASARARLAKLSGKRAARIEYAARATKRELAGADAVLSCAPYQANLALTELALSACVPFLDLGGNPQTVAAQEELARGSTTPVVPDCGVSPGLSNVLAVHLAREHGCDEIRVRCGGLPLEAPDTTENPLRYKLVFSPWGLISEYSGDVPVIRAGRVTSVPALSEVEAFDERHEASPTSNNSPQVVEHLASLGVREYGYMTVRYTGHFALVQGWKTLGYLRGDESADAVLAERLANDPALRYDPARDRDKLILSVRGTREIDGCTRGFELRYDVAADRKTRFAAMELMTSWGITIIAHQIASGRGAPEGFATPERFADGAWVIAEVERRLAQIVR